MATFNKRFYAWFDGLMVLKCIHFLRDHYYPNEEILKCITDWNEATQSIELQPRSTKKELLIAQRHFDKQD